jgi:NADPH-dependent curcumin reductase CurA
MVQSKSLVLARLPVGYPIPGEDLIITTNEVDIEAPPPEGGLILKTNYISYDPYLRAHMRADFPGDVFPINEALDEMAISTVISSSSPRFKAGDVVIGYANFSEYQIFSKKATENTTLGIELTLLKNPLGLDPKIFLGALGMPGITAYSSFYELAKPKKEEVIFVSAASGAVGQIVGQLAKREGLKVIGSVGSDEKLKFIKEELGFDGGFNYKKEKAGDALKRLLAEFGNEGLDIYYDNVGGETLDAALAAMSNFGRISPCSF